MSTAGKRPSRTYGPSVSERQVAADSSTYATASASYITRTEFLDESDSVHHILGRIEQAGAADRESVTTLFEQQVKTDTALAEALVEVVETITLLHQRGKDLRRSLNFLTALVWGMWVALIVLAVAR